MGSQRRETNTKVVEDTANFGNHIAHILLKQANSILEDAAALDTTGNVFDLHTPLIEGLIGGLLLLCECSIRGFLWGV